MLISTILFSACSGAVQDANENEAMNENHNEAVLENVNSDDDSNAELEGVIESMGGDTWVVASITVYVNSAILGDSTYLTGDTIRIQGVRNEDGSLTATEVVLLESANANSNETNENDSNVNDNNINANSNSNFNGNSNDSNSNNDDD